MDIGLNDDIKVAGNKTAKAVFDKLFENDPDFHDAARKLTVWNGYGANSIDFVYNDRKVKRMRYDNFISNYVVNRDNPAYKKFYDELKSQGYNAVRDINDMKFIVELLIVFNKSTSSGDLAVKSFKKLTSDEITKKTIENGARKSAKILATYGAMGVTTFGTSAGITMLYNDKNGDVDKGKIKRRYVKE